MNPITLTGMVLAHRYRSESHMIVVLGIGSSEVEVTVRKEQAPPIGSVWAFPATEWTP